MRILMLTNLYPPHDIGGYEQWCHEVTEGLIARGHAVRVLTSSFRREGAITPDEPDVERVLHLESDLDYYRMSDFFLRRPAQTKANRQFLEKSIEGFDPDVILIWGLWNMSPQIACWAEALRPGRVAYFISSYWPMDEDPHRAFWRLPTNRPWMELVKGPLRRLALHQLGRENYPPAPRFEHAVCCSHFVRETLIEAGALPESAGVLYGGCRPEPFEKARAANGHRSDTLRLLYFGRLIHDKGVHTAVEAAGRLKQSGRLNEIELTLLGSGHPDYEAHLKALVHDLALTAHVTFKEKVPREQIPAELAKHDAFLFTSIWPEPMARSVMEAMAAGLLVIGSEVGGQQEMLTHRQNALTFEAGDADGLARQITTILDHPAEMPILAGRGYALVKEKFTLGRMIKDIESFLNRVFEDKMPVGSFEYS